MSARTVVVGSVTAIAATSSSLRPSRFATCCWTAGGEARHSAVSVVHHDEFRLHRAGSRHVGGKNAEDGEIPHHGKADPAAGVAYHDSVAESEPEEVCRIDAGIDAGQEDR